MDLGKRLLVVDDETLVRRAIRSECEKEGYQVVEANCGAEALRQMDSTRPDLVLLDLVLPDFSGLDVCRHLRRLDPRLPIVVISAKSDEIDIVVALEVGADDYISKPFRAREMLARVAAHLRRVQVERLEPLHGILEFKGLTLDLDERRVLRDGEEVEMTHTEFDLLAYMAVNAGRVLSRERILNQVWGYEYPVETRVIDVHVRNLRRKIEDQSARPFYILAVPGIGYRFTSARAG